jgi:isocitrate/isopropylmalate dehydrogenase
LQFCGHGPLGRQVVDAVHDTIAAGETTRDLGGTLGTMAFTEAVIRRLVPA